MYDFTSLTYAYIFCLLDQILTIGEKIVMSDSKTDFDQFLSIKNESK